MIFFKTVIVTEKAERQMGSAFSVVFQNVILRTNINYRYFSWTTRALISLQRFFNS